jgi:hypothetical protein
MKRIHALALQKQARPDSEAARFIGSLALVTQAVGDFPTVQEYKDAQVAMRL